MFAVLYGAWLTALAAYGLSIAVLCMFLWFASTRTRELAEEATACHAAEFSSVGNLAHNGAGRPRRSKRIGDVADCC
jgi:hypothetical protein